MLCTYQFKWLAGGYCMVRTEQENSDRSKRLGRWNQYAIPALVLTVLVVIFSVSFLLQAYVERNSLPPVDTSAPKEEYEIAKLAAEIREIRSDTYGSLYWLKAVALFVTVGGAVGGYLIGQSKTTKSRREHEDKRLEQERVLENRKNVDAQYQAIVQELSDSSSAVLRAAAAVKLGQTLKSFPAEWDVSPDRQDQLIDLTKNVLAAALAIEADAKVRKTLTSALALHKPWNEGDKKGYADLREIDLSAAKADDAYWAKVDFSYADFYNATVNEASFKRAILYEAQFRETELKNAVLIKAECEEANFKLANLHDADLTGATLVKAKFEGADLEGADLEGANLKGANLERVFNLTQEQLEQTTGDASTGLPEGILPPASWDVQEMGK
jgi:hypothetical protein